MTRIPKKLKDDFEEFLVEVPILLEELQDLLDQSGAYSGVRVGYDDETLGQIEGFYLDVLSGKERVGISQARVNRVFIAFVGEAVIERAESGRAKWALNPVRKDPSFGTPVVIDWAQEDGLAISPVERRELLIENREPFLRDLVEYVETKSAFEEKFFKEFE